MNIKKLMLLILGILILGSCNKTEKKFSNEMIKADSLFNSANYEEAKLLYDKLYKSRPTNLELGKKISEVDSMRNLNRKNIQYQEILKIADSLFANKLFEEAEYVYQEASMILPNSNYPMDKINEIRDILSPYSGSLENTYHIIVGCFKVEDNAFRLKDKLVNEGFKSRFIPRRNGTMNAVTYTSHPDIHDAFNNLNRVKRNVHQDAWVLRHVF